MRIIKRLVVHCSDTPNGRDDKAEDIHRYHKERDFDGIGYHEVIHVDGTVNAGRPHYWVGAHAFGYNGESLGVCLIGRDKFNDLQISSLVQLLTKWRLQYTDAVVVGHYELDADKTCPNIDMRIIRDMVEESLANHHSSD